MQRILPLLAIAFLAGNLHAVQVTNVIDPFTTFQIVSTNNATVTNTTSATSIGGFRTMILTSTGGSTDVNTIFGVDDTAQEMILNTPANATPSFDILWGGEGGTNGLGGVDFGAGQPLDLSTSFLSFALGTTDVASGFKWIFTDTSGNSATNTGTFTVPQSFNIYLSSFSGSIDWRAINYISFSGGGTSGVDMTVLAPIQVVATTVPEPGTWALLATGLALTAIVVRRRAKSRA